MAENSLTDKVAWVTGAGRGIGRSIALALAAKGARVVLSARSGSEIENSAAEMVRLNGRALAIPCDVQKASEIEAAFKAIKANWGAVEILVNNAGTAVFGKIIETSEQDWDTMMATNLRGSFLCCKAVLPDMIARHSGHILNVVSVAGQQAFYNSGAYCASKFGLMGLTKVLRMETRRYNIRVTALMPGATDTAIWGDAKIDRSLVLQPEEVAAAAVAALCTNDVAMIEELVIRPQKGDLP